MLYIVKRQSDRAAIANILTNNAVSGLLVNSTQSDAH